MRADEWDGFDDIVDGWVMSGAASERQTGDGQLRLVDSPPASF